MFFIYLFYNVHTYVLFLDGFHLHYFFWYKLGILEQHWTDTKDIDSPATGTWQIIGTKQTQKQALINFSFLKTSYSYL